MKNTLFTTGCTIFNSAPSPLILQYSDFGPPSLCEDLLGQEWWQWNTHGDSRPRRYDVKVVIYPGTDQQLIEKSFPVIPEKNQDYRYVSYQSAIQFLDSAIEDLSQSNEPYIIDMASQLKSTRRQIQRHFK